MVRCTNLENELVRTLVGRVEVMTQTPERELVARLREGTVEDAGRFGEPRLQRALELVEEPELKEQIRALIASLR